MISQISIDTENKKKSGPAAAVKLLTPKEVAELLKISLSWLAKARMRGDGPPYVPVGAFHSLHRSGAVSVDEVAPAPLHERAIGDPIGRLLMHKIEECRSTAVNLCTRLNAPRNNG